jgi:hypothetical protein
MARQIATLPFVKGLEKGDVEPQLTGDGQLLRAENLIVRERGRLQKRHGFSRLSGTVDDKWLASRKDRPVIFGDAVTVKDSAGIRSGELDEVESRAGLCSISSEVVRASFDEDVNLPEVAFQGDYRALVYNVVGTGVTFELRDRYSNQLVESYAPSSEECTARLVPLPAEDAIAGVFVDGTENIAIIPIDTSGDGDIVTGGLTSLAAWPDVDTDVPIDAVLVDDSILMIVYKEKSAANMVVGRVTMDGAAVDSNASLQVGVSDLKFVTIDKWDTAEGFIAYAKETAPREVRGVCYNTSLVLTRTNTQIATWADDVCGQLSAVVTSENASAVVFWTEIETASLEDNPQLHRGHFIAGAAPAANGTDDGIKGGDVGLWCKPFVDASGRLLYGVHFSRDKRAFLPGVKFYGAQRTYFLLEDRGASLWPTPVGKWLVDVAEAVGKKVPAAATEWRRYQTMVATPQSLGNDQFVVSGIEIGVQRLGLYRPPKAAFHAITVDTSPSQVRPVETLNELVIPGGLPKIFDGQRVVEQGFLCYPDRLELSVTANSAGTWGDTGTVYYRAAYEWHDADGNRYISPMSPAWSQALGNDDDTLHVKVPTLKITHLVSGLVNQDVNVVLYRIDAFGSTVYRRLAEKANDPDARFVQFDDLGFLNGSWGNASNEQEYTRDGVILPNYQPPPFNVATIWKGRQWVAHARYPDRLLVGSKELVEGEGTHFGGAALYLPCDPRGGNIVALEGMADRLALFKDRTILTTSGTGWDERGAGQGYVAPFAVSEGVGCVNSMSVVKTPVGVFFGSDECLYVLTTNFSLKPIGRAVRRVTDDMTITGAALLQERCEVVWVSSEGTVLVYNWLYDLWTTWTGLPAYSAAVIDGVLFYRNTSNKVYYEDNTTYIDWGYLPITRRSRRAGSTRAAAWRNCGSSRSACWATSTPRARRSR